MVLKVRPYYIYNMNNSSRSEWLIGTPKNAVYSKLVNNPFNNAVLWLGQYIRLSTFPSKEVTPLLKKQFLPIALWTFRVGAMVKWLLVWVCVSLQTDWHAYCLYGRMSRVKGQRKAGKVIGPIHIHKHTSHQYRQPTNIDKYQRWLGKRTKVAIHIYLKSIRLSLFIQ